MVLHKMQSEKTKKLKFGAGPESSAPKAPGTFQKPFKIVASGVPFIFLVTADKRAIGLGPNQMELKWKS